MNTKKSIEIYIVLFLVLLGVSFVLYYFLKRNIIDLVYAVLLFMYSGRLSYIEFKKVKAK